MTTKLTEVPRLETTANLANVDMTFVARTATEQVFVVVFESAEAAVQLTGRTVNDLPRANVIVDRNVFVAYEHDRDVPSRISRIRAALDDVP